jgi:hypothetical protein
MNVVWEITDLHADGELITQASYKCVANDENSSVETEGHWYFPNGQVVTPLDQVTEQIVAKWIEDASTINGVSSIKSALQNQLDALKSQKRIGLPWKPSTFTV